MMKKSKGRQKIEMVKMKNESNLQVTFSKRRCGLFKKASEISTLYGAEIAIIVFSPGRKVFSFGHPNVETVIDRFLNDTHPPLHHQNNMQLNETYQNSIVRDLNDHITQVLDQLESEKKKNEELRKIRDISKMAESWWENPIGELGFAQINEIKSHLENLKKALSFEASKYFQASGHHQNFYVGSSSTAAFGNDGGNTLNLDSDQFNQRKMVDMNDVNYNILLSHALPVGNSGNSNIPKGFVLEYNMNYRPEQNHNQNLSFKREETSGYEHDHALPAHYRSDYY